MKILYLLTQDLQSATGAARFFPLARELTRLGHSVTIAALHGDYRSLKETRFVRDGVQVVYVGQMHVRKLGSRKEYFSPFRLLLVSLRATLALTSAALTFPADLIHVAKPHPMNGVAGLAGKFLRRLPLVLDCSDDEAASNRFSGSWQRRGVAFFEDRLPRLADRVTTHAGYLRAKLLAQGIPAEKIVTLPNGVDFERFGASTASRLAGLRAALGLEGKRVVAYVGALTSPAHPVGQLLLAFRQVLQQVPDAALLIVGGGSDYERLQELSRSLGIDASTVFCGRVDPAQVRDYYRLAEVSVDPVDDDETGRGRFPIKLFESWASGVPFVTAAVGDRQALLEPARAGVAVPPGSPEALAGAIQRVLQDASFAETLRQNGLAQARLFDWKALAASMEKAYLDLL